MSGMNFSSRFRRISSDRFRFDSAGSLPKKPLLVRATDVILALLILVFPFCMGGREAWGHRILISLSCSLGFVWCLHRARTGGRFVLLTVEPLLLAGLLLVWFQSVPVSHETLSLMSGEYSRLLPAWSQTQPGLAADTRWSTISLFPQETRHAVLILFSYSLIACVLAQRLGSEEDCYRILKLAGLSGVLMAAFAALQLITSNDRFFWFYRHPYTGTSEVLKGAFTNRNHFAQFLSLSLGPLIWWMLIERSSPENSGRLRSRLAEPASGSHSQFDRVIDPRMLLLVCGAGGVLLSIMLSLSRGGMISAALACLICLGGLWKSGRVKASLAAVMLILGLIAVGGLVLFGQNGVEERISQLASGDADQIDRLNARRSIWKADLAAARAFPVLGTGVGTHRFVYPLYMEDLASFMGVTFSHAESTYINLLLETGLCGLGLLVAGVSFVLARLTWHLLQNPDSRRAAALAAVLAALAGGAVHAAVDFIWYAPAIVVTSLILAVTGFRLCSGFHLNHGLYVPKSGWFVAGMLCLLVLCRCQPKLSQRVNGERLWFQYLIAEFDEAGALSRGLDSDSDLLDSVMSIERLSAVPDSAADSRLDVSPSVALFSSESSDRAAGVPRADSGERPITADEDRKQFRAKAASLKKRIELLTASLRENPHQAEACQHLAQRYLDLFELLQSQGENRLTLSEIRSTVLTSNYDSRASMYRFLQRAFGNNFRLVLLSDQWSRRSLRLCPLSDRCYELLTSTNFVRDPSDRLHNAMIAQMLLTGPHSPRMRYSAGLTLLAAGRQSEAFQELARAFRSGSVMRQTVCRTLGRNRSVDVILNHFQPTADELGDVLTVFQEFDRPTDIGKLAWKIAETIREPLQARPESAESGMEHHAILLMDAYRAAYRFRFHEQCEDLLRLAVRCDSSAEPPRRALGLLMLEQERYAEAEQHFAWCDEQFPGDAKLEELRRECRRLEAIQSRRVIPASWNTNREPN